MMQLEAQERPRWQLVAVEAKRAALAALPPEEREEARRAQIAARERFKRRAEARKALARAIYTRIFEGATLDEIALAIGRTVKSVRDTCASWGFPACQRARARRAPMFWITDDSYAALVRAASDRRSTVAEMLEDLVQFGADDDALILRRLLRVRRAA